MAESNSWTWDFWFSGGLLAVLWLAAAALPRCSDGTDQARDALPSADREPDLARETAESGDTPADLRVSDDLPPPPAFFERGQILPPDSLPCTDLSTGVETYHCNHHGSSVAVTAAGEVLAIWYHGMGEKSPDSKVVWSRRPKGGEWGPTEILYDDPGRGEGNPVIWIREDGELYLFFVTVMGESWNDCIVRLIRSTDDGSNWSEPVVLREEWSWMVRNHPLRLSTGELLLPCYSESLYTPTFMFSADDFDSQWEECGNDDDPAYLIDHLAQIQPSVIERADGSLLALMRNTASYGNKRAMQMTSLDWGRTWTRGEESVLPNDGASIEMIQLADGRLALAFNNTSSGRYPLSLALSEDEGLTWPIVGDCDGPCEEGGCSHGYPSIAQDPTDQSIWVTFTDERATIGWVHTNEQWVMAQHDTLAPPPAR